MSERRIKFARGCDATLDEYGTLFLKDSQGCVAFDRHEINGLRLAIHDLIGIQAPASPDPRQGLRPCEWNGKQGYFHGFSQGPDSWIFAILEDADGEIFMETVDQVRFTDIPTTQEEAPEPESKSEITPGMRVRVAEDAENVNCDGYTIDSNGNGHAGKVGVVQKHQWGETRKVLGIAVGDSGRFVRLSDLTPVEEAEAPAFRFGDQVTANNGKIGLVINTPGDDQIVQVGEPSGDWFYSNFSSLTPGWPETETEGEGV